MARLNEVPAPAESIESLKRRFIRQNRDIAKENSTQSIRIRELEDETSNLRSENLSLREKIIAFGSAGFKACPKDFFVRLEMIKLQFEEKMKDLGGLVEMLAMLQTQAVSECEQAELWGLPTTRRSPDASPKVLEPRRAVFHFDLAPKARERRMTAIVEDDADEIGSVETEDMLDLLWNNAEVADATDSPDLGPPPVVHLESDEEPELPELRTKEKQETAEPTGLLQSNVSTRSEGRKKRRESANVFDFRREHNSEEHVTSSKQDKPKHVEVKGKDQPPKTASKYQATVEDERSDTRDASEGRVTRSDHHNSDKERASEKKPSRSPVVDDGDDRDLTWEEILERVKAESEAERLKAESEAANRNSSSEASPERPALAPMSANSDPTSPRKHRKSTHGSKETVEKGHGTSAIDKPKLTHDFKLTATSRRREQRKTEQKASLDTSSTTTEAPTVQDTPVATNGRRGTVGRSNDTPALHKPKLTHDFKLTAAARRREERKAESKSSLSTSTSTTTSTTTKDAPAVRDTSLGTSHHRTTRARSHSDPTISPSIKEKVDERTGQSLPSTPEDPIKARRRRFGIVLNTPSPCSIEADLGDTDTEKNGPYMSPWKPGQRPRMVDNMSPLSIAATAGGSDTESNRPPPESPAAPPRPEHRVSHRATTHRRGGGDRTKDRADDKAADEHHHRASRTTRRPRSSVNYAEPNLRDKMRRPTKEFVDAVDSRTRRWTVDFHHDP